MSQNPLVPTYVLRGHQSAIHALHFFASNRLLASGDSDGWLVIWQLSSKRPVAVWRAHEGGVMQIKHWTEQRLITHGRDHKLRVWQVRNDDFPGLSAKLPNEGAQDDQAQPWLLHSLSVNALNFCAFSICDQFVEQPSFTEPTQQLLASPNGLDSGGIDIFQLPSERRVSQLQSDPTVNTGMVMAVALFNDVEAEKLVLISGYEDGQVMVHTHSREVSEGGRGQGWSKVMMSKPHSQPVLSLNILSSKGQFITSSADAIIAKFSLDLALAGQDERQVAEKIINTKHAGQQGLSVRSDNKIFATAGWDSRVRVYSCKTMKELAVLKWHKDGCYSTAFANTDFDGRRPEPQQESSNSDSTEIATRLSALDLIKQGREEKARSTHWLAAGGKDAKISLWDIY